jgi:hypothetical protein
MSSTQCEPVSFERQGGENLIDRRNRANNACGESISIVNSACSQIPYQGKKKNQKTGKRKKKEKAKQKHF